MYNFWGKVRKHKQRGRKLGFPTANVDLHQQITEGVYISKTKLSGELFNSLTFIGTAKTFGEKKYHSETYILDFNENIYGQWISIELINKIRGNQAFKSAEDLIEQMKEDERKTRQYFRYL